MFSRVGIPQRAFQRFMSKRKNVKLEKYENPVSNLHFSPVFFVCFDDFIIGHVLKENESMCIVNMKQKFPSILNSLGYCTL